MENGECTRENLAHAREDLHIKMILKIDDPFHIINPIGCITATFKPNFCIFFFPLKQVEIPLLISYPQSISPKT